MLIRVFGTTILIGLAYIIGTVGGEWFANEKRDTLRTEQLNRTQDIIQKMDGASLGDEMPNYSLYDLNGNRHILTGLLTEQTLLIFIDLDCHACLQETELLKEINENGLDLDN